MLGLLGPSALRSLRQFNLLLQYNKKMDSMGAVLLRGQVNESTSDANAYQLSSSSHGGASGMRAAPPLAHVDCTLSPGRPGVVLPSHAIDRARFATAAPPFRSPHYSATRHPAAVVAGRTDGTRRQSRFVWAQ